MSRMTDEPTTDVDAVIEAEATEDTGDFDEPQAGEVESADVDTIDEGEDEVAEAVEEAIDAADTESLEEGLSGTAEAISPPRRPPSRPRSQGAGEARLRRRRPHRPQGV